MLRHIVFFRFKLEKKHMALEAAKNLMSLAAIPGVKSIEVGVDELKSSRSYDIAMTVDFENAADYRIYDTHALHRPVREFMQSVIDSSITVDYTRD